MNVRKSIDRSELLRAIDAIMAEGVTQMKLYHALGRLLADSRDKSAVTAAAEYLKNAYPDAKGFSSRNLRRMRDFCLAYEENSAEIELALEIGWAHNVVILEAGLSDEDRLWYIRAVKQFGWTKQELAKQIEACACEKVTLDTDDPVCYNEPVEIAQENQDDKGAFRLPWEYLPQPHGGICFQGYGKAKGRGEGILDRVRRDQHGGNREQSLPSRTEKTRRAWHQLRGKDCAADARKRLQALRSADRDGSCEPPKYAKNLRRRSGRQDTSSAGLYRPSRRCSRPVVYG